MFLWEHPPRGHVCKLPPKYFMPPLPFSKCNLTHIRVCYVHVTISTVTDSYSLRQTQHFILTYIEQLWITEHWILIATWELQNCGRTVECHLVWHLMMQIILCLMCTTRTREIISKLIADDMSVGLCPSITTDSAPPPIETHLHSSLKLWPSFCQPHLAISTVTYSYSLPLTQQFNHPNIH